MIQWENVDSKAINRIGYESTTNTLYVDFKGSQPNYTYCNVPEEVFNEFLCAQSIGKYYNKHIKDQYQC